MIASHGKPHWLKIRPPTTEKYLVLKQLMSNKKLHTVCEESHCPNMPECWSGGTATFMVMGDACTRGCRFCAVAHAGKGKPLDADEPKKLAEAVKQMNLDCAVITSVDRDDLPDQGAKHFAECIKAVKQEVPGVVVEVLVPDFRASKECLNTIVEAQPHVIAHNIETVKRLQRRARDPKANYEQSLFVLEYVKKTSPKTFTKSSLILGFGEQDEEVIEAMHDLRAIGVDLITIGQYLRPTSLQIEVQEYVAPEKFKFLEQKALEMGFLYAACGPFVRSSYKAGELFVKNILKKKIV